VKAAETEEPGLNPGKSIVDLLAELAEPLAEYMLFDYGEQDWHDDPLVASLACVAATLEAKGRSTPPVVHALLRIASKAV